MAGIASTALSVAGAATGNPLLLAAGGAVGGLKQGGLSGGLVGGLSGFQAGQQAGLQQQPSIGQAFNGGQGAFFTPQQQSFFQQNPAGFFEFQGFK